MYVSFVKKDIESILNKKDYSVEDKIKALKELKENVNMMVDREITDLNESVRKCPYCNKSYLKKFWEEVIEVEERTVCTYWPLVEFEDAEYEKQDVEIVYGICPCGHKVKIKNDF